MWKQNIEIPYKFYQSQRNYLGARDWYTGSGPKWFFCFFCFFCFFKEQEVEEEVILTVGFCVVIGIKWWLFLFLTICWV